MPINFPSNPVTDQIYTFDGKNWKFDGSVWNVVSISAVPPAQSNSYSTVSVAGQSNLVANSPTDTLTFIAGSNVTITTNTVNDSITINSTASGGEASNSFATIAVSGQNSVVADSSNDTLNLVAGNNITITTNSGTDSITIAAASSSGATNLTELTDASSAGLTVDEIYLPAITTLVVTNSGASAYLFDQYSGSNPTIYAIGGTTIAFKLNIGGHPFLIQNGAGVNYDTGLVHVSTTGSVSIGAAAQGQTSGTLYWKVPADISGGYRYQCQVHGVMVGSISVKNIVSV